jgi:hypothetical protein
MFITIVLIILGIALVVVFLNRKKDEEKAKLGIIGITAAAVVLSILSIFWGGRQSQFAYDPSVDQAVAEVAADRIAQAATGRRAVIVAETENATVFTETRLRVLRDRLAQRNMEVLGVISPRPESQAEEGIFLAEEAGLGADAIEYALRQYPNADVLISMVGMPGDDYSQVASRMGRIELFAFDEHPFPGWIRFVEHRAVSGVIVSAIDGDWADTSGSSEQIFDRRYVFVTPDNVGEVKQRVYHDY